MSDVTSTETEPVRIERRGPVGILTIDRESRRNALSRQTLFDLDKLLACHDQSRIQFRAGLATQPAA